MSVANELFGLESHHFIPFHQNFTVLLKTCWAATSRSGVLHSDHPPKIVVHKMDVLRQPVAFDCQDCPFKFFK